MKYKPYYTLEEAAQRVYNFHDLLFRYGIKINEKSDLYRISYNVLEHLEKHRCLSLRDPMADIRPYFREILGFNDFIGKIFSLADHPDFKILLQHLKLMNVSSIPQTTKAITDDGSNKLFELYIAALCLHCFTDVDLESPGGRSKKAKKDNPDVMFTFNNKSWAIACKVINTETIKIKTIMDNYKKGVGQIEKASVDTGIVIINFKNIIDYDEFWPVLNKEKWENGEEPQFGAFANIIVPSYMLYNYGLKILDRINEDYGLEEFTEIYSGKKTVPGFLLFCQTATSIVINNKPVPSILRMFNMIQSPAEFTEELHYLLINLNCVMQSIQ